jgi:hypothetical protein
MSPIESATLMWRSPLSADKARTSESLAVWGDHPPIVSIRPPGMMAKRQSTRASSPPSVAGAKLIRFDFMINQNTSRAKKAARKDPVVITDRGRRSRWANGVPFESLYLSP